MKKETANDHVHSRWLRVYVCECGNERINLSKFVQTVSASINLATGQNETQILSLDVLTFPHRMCALLHAHSMEVDSVVLTLEQRVFINSGRDVDVVVGSLKGMQ